jgi:septum formation protein
MVQEFRRLVLASSSPRRRELLSAAGFVLDILPADIDETPRPGETPRHLVLRLAREKAARTATTATPGSDPIIVAADTAVVLDDVAFSKPVDDDDARQMLRRLSGRTHQVLTGWCVRQGAQQDSGVVETAVTFRALDDDAINRWLATGEHRDKAGAYAIQGGAIVFVAHVDGCLSNVIGLPVDTVVAAVRRLLAGPGQ